MSYDGVAISLRGWRHIFIRRNPGERLERRGKQRGFFQQRSQRIEFHDGGKRLRYILSHIVSRVLCGGVIDQRIAQQS